MVEHGDIGSTSPRRSARNDAPDHRGRRIGHHGRQPVERPRSTTTRKRRTNSRRARRPFLIFATVSGAHFNPAVTLLDRLFGAITTSDLALYAIAQTVGRCLGTIVANLMFSLPAIKLSTHVRSSGALWLSESSQPSGFSSSSTVALVPGAVRLCRSPSGCGSVAPTGSPHQPASQTRQSRSRAPCPTVSPVSNHRRHRRSSSCTCWRSTRLSTDPFPLPSLDHGRRPVTNGATSSTPPEVLFVCVHNAGRFQIAAAFLTHLAN